MMTDMENSIRLWENEVPFFNPDFGQEEPTLTPYIVPEMKDENGKTRKTGCVIVCPGGAYACRADHEGGPISEHFNKYSISSFVLNYRVAPYGHNAIMADVNRAVRYVRYHADEFNIDKDKIAICGFSAGGHLAGSAATHYDKGLDCGDEIDRVSSRPDAAILSYAVASLDYEISHEGTRNNFFSDCGATPELADLYSAEKQITPDTPPMFIWHTFEDEAVNMLIPIRVAEALYKNHVMFELHTFDKGYHGTGLAKNFEGASHWGPLCAEWLKRQGY